MSMQREGMLWSTLANWTAFIVTALVSFFLSPFIVHRLGDAGYGIWVLLGSLVGYLGLLDLGVRGAVTRFIAASHATGDHREASALVVAGLRLFAKLGVIALAVSLILAAALHRISTIPDELLDESRVVVLLGGVSIAVSFVGGVFGGIVAGLHRFDIDGAIEIAITLVRAAAVVAVLQSGYGLIALSLVQLTMTTARAVIAFVVVRRLYPQLNLRGVGPTKKTARKLLSFSMFASLIQFSGLLIYQADSLVIGAFLPIGFVTFYAVAGSLADYARQLVSSIARIITPRASANQAHGGNTAVRAMVATVAPMATLVVAPIAITFLLRGDRFIDLWMGPEYGPSAGPVLALLSGVVWLSGGRSIGAATIMGLNRHRALAFVIVTEALTNLLLSVVFIGQLGIAGVALGTLIPSIVVTLIFIPWFLRRELEIPLSRFVTRTWLLPSVACSAFAAGTYAIERWLGADSLLTFFLQTAALVPLVPLGAAVFVLSREDRAGHYARLTRLANRLRGRSSQTEAALGSASPPASVLDG
jgi:O-antigen/teichoic acid export membrane protein